MGNYHARCGAGEKSEVATPEAYLSLFGTIPEFPQKLSTMRKYNISATIVLQDISQLEAMYETEWRTVMANCSSWIFLGTQEQNTLKYFSDQLGTTTIVTKNRSKGKNGSSGSFSTQQRPVMTSEELGRLPSNECIVFTQNKRPVKDKKYKYESHPYYEQTGDANEDNNFMYRTLAEYDNSKIELINDVVLAQQEASSYVAKQKEKERELKNLEDKEIIENPIIQYDEAVSEKSLELYQDFLIKLQNDIFENDYNDEKMLIFKEHGINYKIHDSLVKELSATTGVPKLLIFSEVPECDYLLGIAISDEPENLGFLDNDYVKSFKTNGNIAYMLLARNNYDTYISLVA